MNEEKYLNERMSKQNPFRVPEGYFDEGKNLTDRLWISY